jgi:cysteinyl-tRNA synthetase
MTKDLKPIKLFNTLSRKIEDFEPIQSKKVKVYTCGLTVYSHPHIGNWVAYIYSDILNRTLIAAGYDVDRIQNITDVGHLVSDSDDGEDKIQKGARLEGLNAWQVAEKYSKICEQESSILNLLKPKLVPATSLIKEQIDFIIELEKKKLTYIIEDGVYFDTSSLKNYGQLARLDIKNLKSGARVEDVGKKNVTDFALWKFSPKNEKRDMEWDSPWGKGFPGWHLECSVIARENLGDQIDIHTGGIDHIPVHHTNEIAQTESLTGKKFVNYWFHNNHMKISNEKLSKSLGNGIYLQDIIDRGFSLDAFKVLVLSSHYRTEGSFTWEILESSFNRLKNWQAAADLRWQQKSDTSRSTGMAKENLEQRILDYLTNDLDTPAALASIDKYFKEVEAYGEDLALLNYNLQVIYDLLGINLLKPDISKEQKNLILGRQNAKNQNDFITADQIRSELLSTGIELQDKPEGTIWSRV